MQVKIEESWRQRLQKEFDSAYFEKLTNFVRYEYQHYRVFPPGRLIFNAFNLCPFDKTKVVIIGRIGSSAGTEFLGARWCEDSSFACEYL